MRIPSISELEISLFNYMTQYDFSWILDSSIITIYFFTFPLCNIVFISFCSYFDERVVNDINKI